MILYYFHRCECGLRQICLYSYQPDHSMGHWHESELFHLARAVMPIWERWVF